MNDSNQESKPSLQSATNKSKRGMVSACPQKWQRLLATRNLSITALSQKTLLSRNWLMKLNRGAPVLRSKLDELCGSLEIPIESLLPDSPTESFVDGLHLAPPKAWTIVKYLGPFRQAANGLCYRTTELRHEYVPEKKARGKFYDLIHLNPQIRSQFVEHLTRHPRVCERIGRHPNITENLDVHPVDSGSGWWVIDPWIEGISLEELFVSSSFQANTRFLRQVGSNVLYGLTAMHKAGVIFRELAPDKVWVTPDHERAVLTDFELAKLTDGAPSVSGKWEIGYFRAPEIGDYDAFPQSDLYSFGRLVLWTLAGGQSKMRSLKGTSLLPANVEEMIQRCLSPFASKRPPSVEAVLKVWKGWQ